MRLVRWIGFFSVLLGLFLQTVRAGTYSLSSGETVSGEPISYNEAGVVLKSNDGTLQPRIAYNRFSQAALKQLTLEGKSPQSSAFIEPFLQEVAQEKEQRKKIEIKEVKRIERPKGRTGLLAMFSSPLGLILFLILYAANIFAGYEIAYFRNQPFAMVCAAAAIVPVIGPLIFLCLPTQPPSNTTQIAAAEPEPEAAPQHSLPPVYSSPPAEVSTGRPVATQNYGAVAEPEAAPATPVFPTVTFKKGEFAFNRRFFETKMPGFFRVVPSEADRDKVVVIRSARGEFTGRRIPNINQTELYLQVFKDNVTADEMIPFGEILEVQLKHKDAV